MKKSIVLAVVFVLVAAVSSFAATSGTVGLTGTVAPTLSVVVGTPSTTLGDVTLGGTAVALGNVTFVCNTKAGYKATFTSTNAGKLKGALLETVDYTFTLATLDSNVSLATPLVHNFTGKTAKAGDVYAMTMSWSAINLAADTYVDTITISVASN